MPGRWFALFSALHGLLWAVLPSVLYPNLPLDLIEALTYGREWQLGYDKLPPLPWWLVEAVYRLIGHDFAYYLLAQVAVVSALTLVFITARPLIGPLGALCAVLIVDGLHYFHFTAAKFNHDVIQLPLWALAGYSFHHALRGGRIVHWLALGAAIGVALWAKYFVVTLAAPLVLFLLLDRQARRHLVTPGPYLAAAIGLVVMAPHLVWLVQNDFLPFAYAESRAAPSSGWIGHIWHPLQFAIGQLFFMLPCLLIALPFFGRQNHGQSRLGSEPPVAVAADAFDRRIVTLLAFGPFATVVVLSVLSGRGTIAMWGYPLWLFLGVFIVMIARRALDERRVTRVVILWAVVFTVAAAGFAASYTVMPRFDHRYRAVFYPGDRLAAEVTQGFRAATGAPLTYVIADMFEGGNIAHYSGDHPRVLIDGKPERAPWISLADLKARGAVVAWEAGDLNALPPQFKDIAAGAQVQPPIRLPFRRGDGLLSVGWAILKPEK
jgi:4-amino-4-deoxy-L-arabinose transferase-like glycosyltransferase